MFQKRHVDKNFQINVANLEKLTVVIQFLLMI